MLPSIVEEKQESTIVMKRLLIVAAMAWVCMPVWGAKSASRQQGAKPHQLANVSQGSQSARRSSRPQASLQNVNFSRAGVDQAKPATSPSRKKSGKKKRTATRRQPKQMVPTPDRVTDIQSALAKGGYYKGDTTGKIDQGTVDALQRFQSANGLSTTGKLDALTLQKLGLGSDIAGVSSPKGIVPHSCCSMSPSPSLVPRPTVAPGGPPAASADPNPSSSLGPSSASSTDPPTTLGTTASN